MARRESGMAAATPLLGRWTSMLRPAEKTWENLLEAAAGIAMHACNLGIHVVNT